MRILLGLALLVGLAGGCPTAASSAAARDPGLRVPISQTSSSGASLRRGLAVLHSWDLLRGRAWAGSDVGSLRSLYAPGSVEAGRDVRLLRAYTDRDLVVRRMQTQVFAARVLATGERSLRLRVLDRTAGGLLLVSGRPVPLPSSGPRLQVLDFEETARGHWVLRSARALSGWERAPRATPPSHPGR